MHRTPGEARTTRAWIIWIGGPLACALACACGGPHLKSHTASQRTYQAVARCGQGPIEATFEAVGGKWGESVEVVACGMHAIRGSIEVEVDGVVRSAGPFGSGPRDNARCLVGDPVAVSSGSGGGEASEAVRGSDSAIATAGPAAPAKRAPAPALVEEIDAPVDICPGAMRTELVLDKLPKGAKIVVRLWSDEPNDLEGALIRIAHLWQKPNVSEAEWEKHLAEQEAERARRDAEAAKKRKPPTEAEMRARIAEAERAQADAELAARSRPSGPPPAPRAEGKPPSPSANAEWVPGYWHWGERDWVWIAGIWRVPEADVRDGLTARAPHAPPGLRDETPPPPPDARAVWTPGYWQWDGAAFVWVAGSWRLAPTVRHRWRSSRWRRTARGQVFVPGGWVTLRP